MSGSQGSADRHLARPRELKEDFVVADRDRDGRIDFQEFAQLLQGLEADMSRAELRLGFEEIDTDGDGLIDYCEFADWWSTD